MQNIDSVFLVLLVIAYLAGSLSTAIIICRFMGLPDPRTQGSKNPGATNMLRLGGKKAAAITLAGDALKGLLPVLLGRLFEQDISQLCLIAIFAFLGHLYPIFFGFKGGKGVATAFGVLTGVSWLVGLLLLATWVLMAIVTRISSISALTAALAAPTFFWFVEQNSVTVILSLVISTLLLWKHRSNIKDLLAGKEEKIG
jgi:glycerol-3-phosphate acyltransferase PlsY